MIDERLVAGKLVHVPEQPVKADVETGARGSDDVETLRRTELARDAGYVDRVRGGRRIGRRPAGLVLSLQLDWQKREQPGGKCKGDPHRPSSLVEEHRSECDSLRRPFTGVLAGGGACRTGLDRVRIRIESGHDLADGSLRLDAVARVVERWRDDGDRELARRDRDDSAAHA